MGRLKKEDSVKPGHLQKGLIRFSFIANREVISRMKSQAKKEGLSIKDFMDKILTEYIQNSTGKKIDRDFIPIEDRTPDNKIEERMIQFHKNKTA